MRITWLDEEMDEAEITVGLLFWKRRAVVFRNNQWRWEFASTGRFVGTRLDSRIDKIKAEVIERRVRSQEWTRIWNSLPVATLKKG